MAQQKRKRKKGGPRPPSKDDLLADLKAFLPDLADDPGPKWGQAHKLLLKTDVDASAVAQVIMQRDLDALRRMVRELSGEAVEAAAPEAPPATAPRADVPADTLKAAMRAFRKRLKLTRLDHESRIGGNNPLTGGKKADFDAIMPPREFPQEVWDALVASGELKPLGSGFYMLGEEG